MMMKFAMSLFLDLTGVKLLPWDDYLDPEKDYLRVMLRPSSSSTFSRIGERLSLSTFFMKILILEISLMTQLASSGFNLKILKSSINECPTIVLSFTIFLICKSFKNKLRKFRNYPKILTIGSIFPKVGAWSKSIGLIPVIHSL